MKSKTFKIVASRSDSHTSFSDSVTIYASNGVRICSASRSSFNFKGIASNMTQSDMLAVLRFRKGTYRIDSSELCTIISTETCQELGII